MEQTHIATEDLLSSPKTRSCASGIPVAKSQNLELVPMSLDFSTGIAFYLDLCNGFHKTQNPIHRPVSYPTYNYFKRILFGVSERNFGRDQNIKVRK